VEIEKNGDGGGGWNYTLFVNGAEVAEPLERGRPLAQAGGGAPASSSSGYGT
jgi:hypothetical protein